MFDKILKFIVLTALMVAIPMIWWQMQPWQAGIKYFLISTGGSLFLVGLCYKLIGTWDLVPDWIPLLGSLDDSVAWIVMVVGIILAIGGFYL